MARESKQSDPGTPGESRPAATLDAPRAITPAAQRALAEAEARRARRQERVVNLPPEVDGRGGAEPVRYGDWEVAGRATDF